MDLPQNMPAIAAAEAIDRETFRIAFGRFVTGVTVITTRCPEERIAGVTVSSFNTLLGPGVSN